MQNFDIAFKSLVLRSAPLFLGNVSGERHAEWIEVELLNMESRRVDLSGQTETGGLIHIEFQSRNDPQMLRRMAEYCCAIYRQFKRVPRQTVVYIGRNRMHMRRDFAVPINGSGTTWWTYANWTAMS